MFLLQLSFQPAIDKTYTGGIAVDDVTLSNGLCEGESEPHNNRQGINFASTTVWVIHLEGLSDMNVFLN